MSALLALFIVSARSAPPASAKVTTGIADPIFSGSDSAERQVWLRKSKGAGARIVRISVSWRELVSRRPIAPRSPADPAYSFGALDAQVADARDAGLSVLLTVTSAPSFAEGPNRPGSAAPGTWKPNPGDLGDFANALATRYSGSFAGLPRVQYLQVWNEPNLSTYLTPQYQGNKPVGAAHFKRMLNAFYDGAKAAPGSVKVMNGGTAPYGDAAGGDRTRPLTFLREIFCLKGGQRKLKPGRCKTKPKLDILAHHPINTSGGPTRSAINPNDASTPDFGQVRRILRAAEQGNNIGPKRRGHQLWATELWWDTKPPNRDGVSPKTQAKWLKQSLGLLKRQGAKVVINFRIRDAASADGRASSSGLYFENGRAKPSLRAWRSGSR